MKIKNLITRELEKTEKYIGILKEEIEALPKGSIVTTKAKDNIYCYLKRREGKRVISVYVGKDTDIETIKLGAEIKKRKKLEEDLLALEEERDLMVKMLKVK